jgi:HK97 family phage portal protein
MTLDMIYRSIAVHATAAMQLTIDVERNGLALANTPSLVRRPCLSMSRSAFIEFYITSMYIDGNAFWLPTFADATSRRPGEVVDLEPLNPREVAIIRDPQTRVVTFSYRGTIYQRNEMIWLQLLRVPGFHRGLGPIQAAQITVAGALDARDYGALWFRESEEPNGVLTTDQELKAGDTETYRNIWYGRNADGSERLGTDGKPIPKSIFERLRVLGKGLRYESLLLKPSDLQFLESQQYSNVSLARLMGAPFSLVGVAVKGSNDTYQNVEQEWIGYIRFELMRALREFEEAFSELLPYGQTARFRIETLLRTDTKSRYEGHKIALDPDTGWMELEEVRALEGLPPLSAAQLDARAARATTRKATAIVNNA